ncbi:TIGR03086 family metal-binding protein [soil metagenome]
MTMLNLQPAAETMAAAALGVAETELDNRTPCPDYRVREILAHVLGLCVAFGAAARKDLGELTSSAPEAGALPDDWRALMPTRLDHLVDAWKSPEAWDGMTQVGGVHLPGEVAGIVAMNELTIHAWDLARSTGQSYEAPESALLTSQGFLSSFDMRDGGPFGPIVPVADDAPLVDRVIGLSGRDPRWPT